MKKAQAALEYTIGLTLVIVAFLLMGIYFKRGVQGGIRDVSDSISSQYDPMNTESDFTYKETGTSNSTTETLDWTISAGDPGAGTVFSVGVVKLKTIVNTKTNTENTRDGWEQVGPLR